MPSVIRYALSRMIRTGSLSVARASGSVFVVGDNTSPSLAIRLTDRSAEWRLALDPALAAGELYMDGRLVMTKGTIYDLLALAARNLGANFGQPPAHPFIRSLRRLQRLARANAASNTTRRSARNVAHHYDLDTRLYDLFLDRNRQYSCAYFDRPDVSLDSAQRAKMRHIAAKLCIDPGHRVLDVGCGWGGLANYLADLHGVDVTGITLSKEQLAKARDQPGNTTRAGNATFQFQDYRSATGTYDRIVSVGMFEHVGAAFYDTYFAKMRNLLTEHGVMLLHSIGTQGVPGHTNPWVEKYIFPGAHVPSLSEVLPAIERAGLLITDVEILRLHYAETLKAWRQRFLANWARAETLYDARFCRMWEFYLAAFEAGFRYGPLMVFQIQLVRANAAVPITRNYIQATEQQLAAREAGQHFTEAAE